MSKGQSFIIAFICTVIGWKAREKYAEKTRNTEGGQRRKQSKNSLKTGENTDFYAGIGGDTEGGKNFTIF